MISPEQVKTITKKVLDKEHLLGFIKIFEKEHNLFRGSHDKIGLPASIVEGIQAAATFEGLSDTSVAAPIAGDFVQYDGALKKWKRMAALTEGSIVFPDADGYFTEDATNLFWDDTEKALGIGTNVIAGTGAGYKVRVHIVGEDGKLSGATYLHPGVNLIIENDVKAGIQIVCGTDAYIIFTDADSNPPAGLINYDHANDQLDFGVATNVLVRFEKANNLISYHRAVWVDSTTYAAFIADAHNADAYLDLQEDGDRKWTVGIDYSDSFNFKISQQNVPGTQTRFEIETGGNINCYIHTCMKDGIELRFYKLTQYVGFKCPGTLSGDQIWVLPAADGPANEVWGTDGAGNLIWRTHDELADFVASEHLPALDEDDLTSDSDTSVATQQSIKAYVDAQASLDEKVKVDAAATAGYLGVAFGDGVLRVTENELTVTDGGDFITLGLADHNTARTALGLAIGSDVQAYHASLASIAGLTYASGSFIALTGADTYAVRTYAEVLSDIGAQPSDAELTAIAGLTSAADRYIRFTGSGTADLRTYAQVLSDIGGLANLVEDTTPQLGGDLDLNGKNIDFPSVANISDCKDEDNMASDSATMLATQQSIKKYVDDSVAAVAGHAILDGSVHTDSVADVVTRGSIIYGNATPKWDELVIGAANTFLGSDGTDPSYRTAAQVLASLSGAAGAAFSWNNQNLTAIGTLSSGNYSVADDVIHIFGTGSDYAIGFRSTDSTFQVVTGSTLGTTVRWQIAADKQTTFFGAPNVVAFKLKGDGTAGQSYGLLVSAGTNSSDRAFSVENYDEDTTYFYIRGDGWVGIHETSNAFMTQGLTINQGAVTNEILSFKNSGVAHGITDFAETDTYGFFSLADSGDGGIKIWGLTESNYAFFLTGLVTVENTDKDAGALAPILFDCHKKDGTGVGNFGADANILAVKQRGLTRFIVDVEGDIFYDGAASSYQGHDDIELLAELEDVLSNKISKQEMKGKDIYKKHNIIHVSEGLTEENEPYFSRFVSTKKKNMLIYGAIRQLNEKIKVLEAQLNNI